MYGVRPGTQFLCQIRAISAGLSSISQPPELVYCDWNESQVSSLHGTIPREPFSALTWGHLDMVQVVTSPVVLPKLSLFVPPKLPRDEIRS
ncbi:hypothetical protein CONLIGDRAFT_431232 [Coniochaeta ligniaria NRRL 30616]|uniref:Uncharacterized protein n=1 Tax=Coniochaeta ligniaria NRRL 30616 TaxID=1408157 RepID=A0A1J7IJB0_9PEZI|nr:hypothetical protein CONLIGDRAFT_431232 [Coniochaeta ligniaria NRRL 30616]